MKTKMKGRRWWSKLMLKQEKETREKKKRLNR
jgi:hypothetical protein